MTEKCMSSLVCVIYKNLTKKKKKIRDNDHFTSK